MASNSIFALLLVFPLLATLLAWILGIGPLHFWSTPVAAGLPWLIPLGVVLIFAKRVPGESQDAAIMLGMFPILAAVVFIAIAFLVSFFLGGNLSLKHRFLWPFIVSLVPAGLMALGLLILYIINIKEAKVASAQPQNSETVQVKSEPGKLSNT